MLTKVTRSKLAQISPSNYSAVVLVEGSEAEIFADPSRWFPDISVLIVECGGFPGVGSVYGSLVTTCGSRLLPTVDQDSLVDKKPAPEESAWNSPRLFQFCRTFEDVFDDWMLAEALCSEWESKGNDWKLTEEEVARARAEALQAGVGILIKVEEYGSNKYSDQGFQLPGKPAIARQLGRLMLCNFWIPRELQQWIKEIYLAAGFCVDRPSVPEESFELVNWEAARTARLTGFLVACEGGRLLAVDFDRQNAGSLNMQPSTVIPSANPMFSPTGDAILFQGKSVHRKKTVSAVLTNDGGEIVIDIGGANRGTSVCDWDPRANQFFYVHGPDIRSYRMWRRSLSGSSTIPVEPHTHGGVLCRVGGRVLGLGSSDDRTQSFHLQDTTLVAQKDIAGWHPLAADHGSTAFAWDYHRMDGSFAVAQPAVRDHGDSVMRVFIGRLKSDNQEVVEARLVARPLRRVMSLCWSPDSRYLVTTSAYEKVAHLVDVKTGCIRTLIRGEMRVSGRSWLSTKPDQWCIEAKQSHKRCRDKQ